MILLQSVFIFVKNISLHLLSRNFIFAIIIINSDNWNLTKLEIYNFN